NRHASRLLTPSVCALVLAALPCVIFAAGGFGYSDFTPNPDAVVSASISYVGSPSYLPEKAVGSSTGITHYVMSTINVKEQASISSVADLHRELINEGTPKLGEDKSYFAGTGVPYDIYVSYSMADGSTVERYYDSITLEGLASLLKLGDLPEVRENIMSTITSERRANYFTAEAYSSGAVYFADGLYSDVRRVELDDEQRREMLNAIATDTVSMTSDELYHPQDRTLGVILFTLEDRETKTFTYDLSDAVVYLTAKHENTIALLEKWELASFFEGSAEVESITIQRFSPFSVVSGLKRPMSMYFMGYTLSSPNQFIVEQDFGKLPQITKEDKISELLPLLRNGYYMDQGGYLACIKLRGAEKYTYLFLPEELAPDSIKSKF
ncbi:MAG: hypothetical protein HUJ65_03295, partial [Oscillospiraceae bacterium]|nr:hypothetical protein [Oscillospiraceae bacterium]